MDVASPGNLGRIQAIYPQLAVLKEQLWAQWFKDKETEKAIQKVYQQYGYTLDPHTAVGYLAAEKYKHKEGTEGPIIILGTAHPAKFADIVEPLIQSKVSLPTRLRTCLYEKKHSAGMPGTYDSFKIFY